jgi:hypothetical protein
MSLDLQSLRMALRLLRFCPQGKGQMDDAGVVGLDDSTVIATRRDAALFFNHTRAVVLESAGPAGPVGPTLALVIGERQRYTNHG